MVGTFALLVMHNLGHLGAPSAIVEDVVVDPALPRPRHRPGDDALRASSAAERSGCYKLVLSSERQARPGARLLRVARLRAPRLQLPRSISTGDRRMSSIAETDQPLLIADSV